MLSSLAKIIKKKFRKLIFVLKIGVYLCSQYDTTNKNIKHEHSKKLRRIG
jgi:hypothetical protein